MKLNELLEIRYPLIQAPMAGASDFRLAAAVSNCGALGSLPAAAFSHPELLSQLEQLTEHTTKPFNVNFFCHSPPKGCHTTGSRWRKQLQPYFNEYGINSSSIDTQTKRKPFDHTTAEILEPFSPAVVSFHFGLPSQDLVKRVKSWGSLIFATATTLEEARYLEAKGADAIIAQGTEAGGHRGIFLTDDLACQLGTFALVPLLKQHINIPIVAAGGIGDANGVSACLALGASGTQIGTSFLLCEEATTNAIHRAVLKSDAAQQTTITNVFTGRPARSINNRLINELGPMSSQVGEFPIAANAINALRSRIEAIGLADFTPLFCGQNISGCEEVPAKIIVERLTQNLN